MNRFAIAQIKPEPGDIAKNMDKHIYWIIHAKSQSAQFIGFPELSLTGYEPKLARELAFLPDDERLDVFDDLAKNCRMTICLGLPVQSRFGIKIGMMIF